MPKPNDSHVLKTLNSICYRIHTEPASMRLHMSELSTLLNVHDPKQTSKYCWLEMFIRQAQLNRFTEHCTQSGGTPVLCLVRIQGKNTYNLCFTHDVDECICCLRSLCEQPIELVAYGRAKLSPEALLEVLSEPQIQKNRWFSLTDSQLERIVRTLKPQESLIPR
ncbi:hypothetical protein L1D54_06895 [Vibrio brasiliensis]|uniref:hypothetical protein n=1 Tax=Vibrio brasiliensis TaxID=170652 RepID=UPI001EFE82CC|nr:hypothetical protein [Vibrio brasiliensis]MCG9750201.1 hypothetical protein [Vibrio brasiliensis]